MSDLRVNLLDEITKFNKGLHHEAYKFLGNHFSVEDGKEGYRFTVWAPRAKNVYLMGDFNNWENERLEPVYESGVWSIFRQEVYPNQRYKYNIEGQNGEFNAKIDPFSNQYEVPPKDASVVTQVTPFQWEDDDYLETRKNKDIKTSPINIYEVHKSSWRKHLDGSEYSFDDLIEHLIPYVKEMGYTHIELMPVMEHPLEASWGYQITGYFAVAGRFGDALGLKRFVNAAHKNNIGILLDWVPGHFCQNIEALAKYDGSPTFEYENPIRGVNKRWGALNFDLGKTQVQSFLNSSLMYWLQEFHVDGVRVDAVSNILYLDYDLEPHILNDDGSNDNRQGVQFIKQMNTLVKEKMPGVMMIAEESTNWEGITKPVAEGGLGFDFKWNMGWMNDILRFFEMDPLYRHSQFNLVTFIFVYMHHENYILPLSHDEVVHGKGSLLGKMPGDRYNQFAQLKVLYTLMQALPGGSLNFMGNELGQFLEWRFYSELEWKDLSFEFNREYHHYVKTINHILLETPAFYEQSFDPKGIEVLYADEKETTLVMERKGKDASIWVVLNFVPVERQDFSIEVDEGVYECFVNSELQEYGGVWTQNIEEMKTEDNKISFTLPAYGALLIRKRG